MEFLSAHPLLDFIGALAFLCWVVRGVFWLVEKHASEVEDEGDED